MLQPVDWLKRLFASKKRDEMIQIFTPRLASKHGLTTRLVVAGATVVGLATSGAIALGAFLTLVLALGFIYFLLTQVLGIRLDVDPQAFVERARDYANAAYSN